MNQTGSLNYVDSYLQMKLVKMSTNQIKSAKLAKRAIKVTNLVVTLHQLVEMSSRLSPSRLNIWSVNCSSLDTLVTNFNKPEQHKTWQHTDEDLRSEESKEWLK